MLDPSRLDRDWTTLTNLTDSAPHIPPPIPRTRLIGREAERAAAHSFLLDDAVPLLTLIGPGGVGKTRLALAVAAEVIDRFADGIVWIDFAPLGDATLVPATVARAIGIVPRPGQPIEEEIAGRLRPHQCLLLLDNCEHVSRAVADLISALLATSPALQVLATSRAPLRIRGEQELPVEPLPLPAVDAPVAPDVIEHSDAVRLLVERAQAVRPAFRLDPDVADDVVAICGQLDGLPLAIELAAAHLRVLTPAALRARLERRLPLLEGGARDAPARQRTIRAAIAWSYDLLSSEEQTVFRRLAVFSGGFTLETAQAVATRDPDSDMLPFLERLTEQNLIRIVPSTVEPRFTMLETIREFGLKRPRLATTGVTPGCTQGWQPPEPRDQTSSSRG